jgi:hypothetical protein
MIGNPGLTRHALVRSVKQGDPCDATLSAVVVRLLAIALMVLRWDMREDPLPGMMVPQDYRAWPFIESDANAPGLPRHHRFFVCLKAAVSTDDEAFPVGTALVVEAFSRAPSDGGRLQSVFCDGKGFEYLCSWQARGFSRNVGLCRL